MTREQLEKFALNLRNEIECEREERNYFQLERDKLRTFWEIAKTRLGKYICFELLMARFSLFNFLVDFSWTMMNAEEAKLEVRKKDREVEVAQEQAELDIKHIGQKMKHLLHENQNRIGEIHAKSMTELKWAQEDHGMKEHELLNDKRELRHSLHERDETIEMQLQQLKMKHSELLR